VPSLLKYTEIHGLQNQIKLETATSFTYANVSISVCGNQIFTIKMNTNVCIIELNAKHLCTLNTI